MEQCKCRARGKEKPYGDVDIIIGLEGSDRVEVVEQVGTGSGIWGWWERVWSHSGALARGGRGCGGGRADS